jgi:hypothetical protein
LGSRARLYFGEEGNLYVFKTYAKLKDVPNRSIGVCDENTG